MNEKGDVVYREKAPYSPWMYVLMLFLIGGLTVVMLVAMLVEPAPEWVGLIMFPVLMAIYLFALFSFFSMRFEITQSAVVATMWPFRTVVPFEDIESVEVIQKLPLWIGWGDRIWYRRGFVRAFVSRRGSAVLIKRTSARLKNLILTVHHPKMFKEQLEKAMKG